MGKMLTLSNPSKFTGVTAAVQFLLIRKLLLCCFSLRYIPSTHRKCSVHHSPEELGRHCLLLFAERLNWARLYPWQARNMHAFAVLIFWFLLGGRKLKSELLETLLHTFPHIFTLTITSRNEVSIISSPQRETATTLISVSTHGTCRSTLKLQESFNDLVHVQSPN